MKADFNFVEYSKTLEEFIIKAKKNRFIGDENRQSLIEPLCNLLGISKIRMEKTPLSANFEHLHGELQEDYFISPDQETIDENRFVTFSEGNDNVVKIDYFFYQNKNDPDWNEEDKIHLSTLSKIIFVYSSSYLLQNYIGYINSHDLRFSNISNSIFLNRFIQKLISEDRLSQFCLASFNIDNFSSINRKFGQKKGTAILETFLIGLQKIVKNKDDDLEKGEVASSGGDNGLVLFHKKDQPQIMKYLTGTDISVELNDGTTDTISLSAHSGMNLNLKDFTNPYDVVDSVNLALNIARRSDASKIVFYDDVLNTKIDNQKQIESWFMNAIKNEEFEVYYQPKIDLHNYKLYGAEALVRWFHDGNLIYPDQFIPILERNMKIKYLDLYMLNHVCEQISDWIAEGIEPVQVSVNLSRASLGMQNIVTVITSTIDEYQIPRNLIQIELTESASGASNEELSRVVSELSAEGISTAMDDFGTGYSSLSLIKELPWDVLKIDKCLLEGAQKTGSNDQRMFKSIISMANDLGLECIVEGVETRDDIRLLKESNCWLAQGYYFSKPIPKDEFIKLM